MILEERSHFEKNMDIGQCPGAETCFKLYHFFLLSCNKAVMVHGMELSSV